MRAELPGYFAPLNYIISDAVVVSRVTVTADKVDRCPIFPDSRCDDRRTCSRFKRKSAVNTRSVKAQWGLCKNDPLTNGVRVADHG